MKSFLSLLKMDLCRALYSFNFMNTTVFIMLIMLISCSGFITKSSDVIGLLGHALSGSGSLLFILCIAPILPYGMAFASDVEDKAMPFWIVRVGIAKYVSSKFIVAAFTGFLSVAVSMTVFSLLLSLFFPLFNELSTSDSYAVLLEGGHLILYVVVLVIHYSLSAALFGGGAIAISTIITDKFSVIAIPIVIYFVFMRLTDLTSIPEFLKVSMLVQGIYPGITPLAAFLFKIIPVIAILLTLWFVTIKQMNKRMGTA